MVLVGKSLIAPSMHTPKSIVQFAALFHFAEFDGSTYRTTSNRLTLNSVPGG
jgi:hypothetical protein